MSLNKWNNYRKKYIEGSTGVNTSGGSFSDDEEERRRRESQALYNQYAEEVSSLSDGLDKWEQYKSKYGIGNNEAPSIKDNAIAELKRNNEARVQENNAIAEAMPELERKYLGIDTEETNKAKDLYDSLSDNNKRLVDSYVRNKRNMSGTPESFEAIKQANPGWDDAQVKNITDAAVLLADTKDKGSVLNSNEQLMYSKGKINELSKEEKNYVQKAVKALENQNLTTRDINPINLKDPIKRQSFEASIEKNKEAYDSLEEAKSGLKDLGWDDNKIDEYLDYASRIGNKNAQDKINAQYDISPDAPDWYKRYKSVENSLKSIENAPKQGLASLGAKLMDNKSQMGIDANSMLLSPLNETEYATNQVVNNAITDKHPIGQNIYQYGMSTAESAAIQATFGVLGKGAVLADFSAQIYGSAYQDAKERGANNRQANQYGILSAIAEAGAEMLSLDHLWSMAKGKKIGKNIFIDWLAQTGIEGSEEGVTDIANRLSDYIIFGADGKSQYQVDVDNYLKENPEASEKEAKNNAWKNIFKEIGNDVIGGAFSGAIMGAGGVAAGYANASQNKQTNQNISNYMNNRLMEQRYDDNLTKEQAERYAKNPTQYIADNISEDTEETRQAKQNIQEYADKVDNGGRLTASDRNDIENSIQEAAIAQEKYNRYIEEVTQPKNDIEDAYKVNVKIAEDVVKKQYEGDQSKFINETSKNLPTESQEGYINLYEENKDKVSAAQFEVAYNRFFRAGQNNVDFESQLNEDNSVYLNMLGEDTVRSMYEAGVSQAKIDGIDKIDTAIKSDPNIGKIGRVIDNGSVKLSQDQAAGLDMIAKTVGLDIEIRNATEDGERASYSLSDGKITLTANNVSSVFHELGHYMKDFAPSEYNSLKVGILNAYASSVGSNSFNNEYQKYVNTYGDIKANEITDEMANSMFVGLMTSEEGQIAFDDFLKKNYKPNQIQKIVNSIKDFFDRAFAALRNMISNSDMSVMERKTYEANLNSKEKLVNDYISTLQAAVKNKNAQNGNATVTDLEGNDIKFSKNTDRVKNESDNFLNRILAAKKNNFASRDNLLVSNYTSDILKLVGVEEKESYMTLSHLINIMTPKNGKNIHYHGLSEGEVSQAIEVMESPAMIIDSPDNADTIILVSEKTDSDKWPLVLILRPNGGATKNYKTIDVNFMKSFYGRDKFQNWINRIAQPSNVLYVNKTKTQVLFGGLGLQLPSGLNTLEYDKILHKSNNLVNILDENNLKSKISNGIKDYFRDSKVVDKDRRLKVMYHGSSAYGFDVFDIKKAKSTGLYGKGFYFSDSNSHAGTYGNTYEVYLNIVNPCMEGTHDLTKDQMLELINAIADDEDYGIENYGYGATPQSILKDMWGNDDFGMLQDLNATCVGDFVSLLKLCNKVNGTTYDGIIVPTETVAFYSNQIKDIHNENPTDGDNIHFSLNVDEYKELENAAKNNKNVDIEKDLIAVHNLTGEQLLADIDLKGLPSPSIAIIRSGMEHSKYGDISLVFNKDAIDPKKNKNNKVYGGDAWTPTFPTVDYKVNEKVLSEASKKIYDIVGGYDALNQFGYVSLDADQFEDYLRNYRGNIYEALSRKQGLKYAFIKSENSNYELPYKTETQEFTGADGHPVAVFKFMIDYMGDRFDEIRGMSNFLHKHIYENHSIGQEIMDAVNAYYRENGLDVDFYGDEINLDFKPDAMKIAKVFRSAIKVANGELNKEVTTFDSVKFDSDFENAGGEVGYEDWINTLFDGIVEKQGIRNDKDIFTSSGSRRSWDVLHDEYNLENIVKAMNREESKGADGFFANTAIQAIATKNFKSIDDIRKNKYMLRTIDDAEYENMQSEFNNRLIEIARAVQDPNESNSFVALDNATSSLAEAIKNGISLESIERGLQKESKWLNIQKDTAQKLYELCRDISEMPTGYFEAKPRRAVWLNEISKVILPSNSSEKLFKKLDANRIAYETYEPGNETERKELLSKSDEKFSLNVDEYGFIIDDATEDDLFLGSSEITENTRSILEEGMEALKGQEVDKTKINKIATKLRNEFKSTIKHKTLSDQLEQVFAYMQSADHVNYNDMMRILSEVARPVLEQSTEKVGVEPYNNFRNALKGYKIALSDNQKKEVANVFGSYSNFAKAMMPVTFSNEGSSLDSIWSELVDATGGILDMSLNDADQPLALYDTLQALKPTVQNTYNGSLEDASKDLAMRIVEEYFSEQADEKSKETVKQLKQQTKEYEKNLRDTYVERYKEVKASMSKIQKLRDTAYADQIASLKAKNKKAAEKSRANKEINHEKSMVEKEIKRLIKWIDKPTEQNHVPSEMVEPILEFANALDWIEPDIRMNSKGNYVLRVFSHSEIVDGKTKPVFVTIEDTDRSEVLRRYRNAIGAGAGSQNARGWVDRMNLMKDLLNQAKDGDTFENSDMNTFIGNIDPTLANVFSDLLKRNKNVLSIKQLSAADFNILKNTLRSITHAIETRNKAVAQRGEISQWANSTLERAKNVKLKAHSKFVNAATKNLGLDMMTPDTFFHFQGEGGQAIMTGLNNGFDTKVRDIQNTQKYMQDVLKDVKAKDFREWRGNNARVYSFPVMDGEIRLTKAQIMSLYELNKRNQAVLHYKGGIKAENITVKGREYRQNEPLHLSNVDIAAIINTLTDEEKAIADKMQQYLAKNCAEWGNEASKKMYGYEKFTDDNYFPIKTDSDSNAIKNNGDTIETLNSIERSSFTKNLTDFAANAIMLQDIFSVFENHVEEMAAYHGYAPAIKDTIRWMNYNEVFQMEDNEEFNISTPVKRAINNNLGRTDNEGINYLKKFLKDLNGSEKSSGIQSLPDYLVSSYKAAAIGGNLRVVIQQPTAYFRALNEINPKYLFSPSTLSKSLPGIASKNIDRIKEISPTVWWKSQGFYETALGRSLDEMITGQMGVRDKLTEASMFLAGKADDITWSALYTAVEKEQKAKLKGENLSEEEFREKVNERFNQVIARTQVVDSTLQKSQWMRSKDKLDKLRTAFMAEPTKSYNIALKSMIDDYQNKGANVLKWKSTRKAIGVLLLTDVANSVAQALIDGIRYKDDDDYWETWLEYFQKNLVDNVNPLNRIPVMKDISDKVISLITDENTYGQNSDMSDQAISDILKVFTTWQARMKGGVFTKPLSYNEYKVYAKAISSLTGVPLYNVSREVMSIHNMVTDDPWGKKESTNKYADVKNAIKMDRSQDKIENQLKSVLEQGGNLDDYESMVQGMFKSDYLEAKDSGDTDTMNSIMDKAVKAYMAGGKTESEAKKMVDEWSPAKYGMSNLYKEIANGGDVKASVDRLIKEGKDPYDIVEGLVDKYDDTISYNRANNIDSDVYDNVMKAIKAAEPSYSYQEAKTVVKETQQKKAEEKAEREAKSESKKKIYEAIDSGTDYMNSLREYYKAGYDLGSLKGDLTSDYVKPAVVKYYTGDKSEKEEARKTLVRIATVKATIDEAKGTNIAKKYGGDYYSYELDEIYKMFDKYEEEPWD